eukprot:4343486-Heterocapsa_arctica.AAC.1
MSEVVRKYGHALEHASEKLKGDREFMLQAAKHKVSALQYASLGLKGDRQFILQAIKHKGAALQYASL